jgi:hypothetical protein
MIHTDRLGRAPKAFRRLTGITPTAFDRLLAQLIPRYEQAGARIAPGDGVSRAAAASMPWSWPTGS